MNTSLGYLKKALTNERVLLAGGGDKALNDFASKIEGKINLTSTSAILAALESLSQDGDYKIYIIADNDGNLPSNKPAVTIPATCIKRLTATIIGGNLTSLIPDSLFSSRGANVSDLIIIARITTTIGELKNVYGNIIPGDNSTIVSMYSYKILATNDAKPTGYTSNGYVVSDGVMGLESPWDKVLIDKIPNLETLIASKLTVYTGSVNAGSGSDVSPLGLFTNVTTGRTDGAVGNWVMLNSGGWDTNALLAIDKGNGALYSRLVSGSWGRVLRNLDNIEGIDHGYTVYLNSTGSYNFAHPLSLRNSSRTDGLATILSIGGPDDYLGVGYFGFVYKGDTSTDAGLANFTTIGIYNLDYIINATAAGNVGIGTTTPSEKLLVNGNVLASTYKTGSCYITSGGTDSVDLSIFGASSMTLQAGSLSTGTININGDAKINNNTIWHEGNDGTGSGLDADLLDGCHAGFNNGNALKLVSFPTYTWFNELNWYTGTDTVAYLLSICKWAIDTYANNGDITLVGLGAPNSLGTIILSLYSNAGKNNETGYPRYCSGIFKNLGDSLLIFLVVDYVWSFKEIANCSDYLPLTGGALKNSAYGGQLTIWRDDATNDPVIVYKNNTKELGRLGFTNNSNPYPYVTFDSGNTVYALLHSGNISNYITSGKEAVYLASGTSFTVDPNKEYFFQNITLNTTITLNAPSSANALAKVNEYKLNFYVTYNNRTITINPSSNIYWEKPFSPSGGRRYEISILYNDNTKRYYAVYSYWNAS